MLDDSRHFGELEDRVMVAVYYSNNDELIDYAVESYIIFLKNNPEKKIGGSWVWPGYVPNFTTKEKLNV